jgi:cysteine-rich repeat protein
MDPRSFGRLLSTILLGSILVALPAAAQAVCGDGEIDGQLEECDDGNVLDGDCCSSICTTDSFGTPCGPDDGNPCTDEICNGEGQCFSDIDQENPCSDGNACTILDYCNSDGFCTSDNPLEEGDTCFDVNLCGGSGLCTNGDCIGDPASCDGFGDQCNTAFCDVAVR